MTPGTSLHIQPFTVLTEPEQEIVPPDKTDMD